MPADISIVAGETEPLSGSISLLSTSSLGDSDLSTLKLYARKKGATANHVDGTAVSTSVSSADNGDGTYTVTVTWTFDPVGAKSGGGNAFDAEGIYPCELIATWADADITKHIQDSTGKRLTALVAASYA